MGLAGYAIDKAVSTSVDIAKGMLIPAYVFPPVTPIGIFMPTGTGGPGTIAEGARSFLDGSDHLANARDQLSSLCTGLSSTDWSGDDRTLFDKTVTDLGDQLDIASTYARVVGACLAGVAVPLGAYAGVCLGIGGVLMSEALFFEAAVASVVGNLGPSEAAYAAGCATAGTCLAVLAGVLAGYAALMQAAAAVIGIGGMVDAKKQSDHGDSSAINNYKDAQVDGLAEAGENLEKWAVAVGTEFVTRGRGPAGQSVAQRMERGADLAEKVGGYNDAAWDLIHGDPLQAAEDLTGYGAEIDQVEDLFSDDEVPNDHTDRQYSLPPTPPPPAIPPPPIIPIPPAQDGPQIIPLPPADDDDPGIIPAGVDINGTPVSKGQQV